MVTGEINSLQGIHLDSSEAAANQELELRCLLSPFDLRFVCLNKSTKAFIRMGVINSDNGSSWSPGSLKSLFSDLLNQDKSIQSLICSLSGLPFTLVPASISDRSLNDQFLKIVHGEEASNVQENLLEDRDTKIISSPPGYWKDEIAQVFPAVQIELHIKSELNKILQVGASGKRNLVYAYQGQSYLQLAAWDKAKGLVLANQFETGATEDSLFFVSNAIASLKFDSEETSIVLGGDIPSDGMLYHSLNKYYKNISHPRIKPSVETNGFLSSFAASIIGWDLCE